MRARRLVSPLPFQMEVEEFDLHLLDGAPPPGTVLVEAVTTAVSAGTEIANYRGVTNNRTTTLGNPFYPGYSFAGRVLDVGEGVGSVKPGDRVCGQMRHTSHAIVSDLSRLWVIPDAVSHDQAALSTLGCIVLNAVRIARVQLGESVAVVGAGLIGQIAAQLCRLSGGRPVVSLDYIPRRRETALRCGADAAVDPAAPDAAERLHALAPDGFPVVFEATGSAAAVNPALKLAGRGGRVVLLGSTRGLVNDFDPYDDVHRKGVAILGAHMSTTPDLPNLANPWTESANRRVILDLLGRGELNVDALVTDRVAPSAAPRIYADLAAHPNDFLGVLFDWTKEM